MGYIQNSLKERSADAYCVLRDPPLLTFHITYAAIVSALPQEGDFNNDGAKIRE
jgi:hypothetical protein